MWWMKNFPDGHQTPHNTECVYTMISLCWVLLSPTGSAGFIYISLTSVFIDSSDILSDPLSVTTRPTSYLSILLNVLWACACGIHIFRCIWLLFLAFDLRCICYILVNLFLRTSGLSPEDGSRQLLKHCDC